jgi:hypothetical protein
VSECTPLRAVPTACFHNTEAAGTQLRQRAQQLQGKAAPGNVCQCGKQLRCAIADVCTHDITCVAADSGVCSGQGHACVAAGM